jgi:hypothetical protein
MRDGGGAEHSFPDAADAHDGAVGAEGLHTHPAEVACDAEATLRPRQAQVSEQTKREVAKPLPESSKSGWLETGPEEGWARKSCLESHAPQKSMLTLMFWVILV